MANNPALNESHGQDLLQCFSEFDSRSMQLCQGITSQITKLTGAAVASVGLMGKATVHYRAATGLPDRDMSTHETFCAHAIKASGLTLVSDASQDARFRELELVAGPSGIRFYASAPLRTTDGLTLGTLCVLDRQPRHDLGALGGDGLQQMADLVTEHLETRILLNEASGLRRLQTEHQQIFDAFARTSHSGYAMFDADGTIERISGFTSRLLGYAPEDLCGGSITQLVPAKYAAIVLDQARSVASEGTTRSGVWKVVHRNGRPLYMQISGERILNAAGERLAFASMTDVTADYLRNRLRIDRAQILELLARRLSLQAIMAELLQLLPRYAPGAVGALADFDGDTPTVLSAPNVTQTQVMPLEELLRSPDSPAGMMQIKNNVTATPDLLSSRTYAGQDAARRGGWRAMAWLPIRHPDGTLRAGLGVLRETSGALRQQEINLLTELAAVAASVLETGMLLDEMHFQAHHDALTGLANRRLLSKHTSQALKAAAGAGKRVALFMLDLDNFKTVNDTLGHNAGDELLQQVAARLTACTRDGDTIARLGGDEFVVVAPGADEHIAAALAERMMHRLRPPVALGRQSVSVRLSIGIALSGTDGDCAHELMTAADAAMYAAKAKGRDCYHFRTQQTGLPVATPVPTADEPLPTGIGLSN